MDLIDRQEAIKALCKAGCDSGHCGVSCDDVKAIEDLPSAYQWIPCSERLPTKKTEVIYSLENHYVSTGYMTDRDYNGNEMELHWEDMESGALIYPEAWMPLPAPYDPLHGAMNPPEDDIKTSMATILLITQ